MLALADKNGEVQASIPGLARIAGVSVSDCETAIGKFLAPDRYSRTTDDEGRRIEPIEGGWVLINHAKYREMASRDEAREADTKRKRRYREQLKRNGKLSQNVRDMSHDVPKNLHIAEADTEAEAKADGGDEEPPHPPLDFEKSPPEKHNPNRMATFEEVMKFAKSQPMPITDDCCEAFFDRMEAEGWVTPRGLPLADWRARFRTWATNWTNNANAKNNR